MKFDVINFTWEQTTSKMQKIVENIFCTLENQNLKKKLEKVNEKLTNNKQKKL